ncbi:ATP-binding cassette domain-containing protein [Luteolibacter yonseiensis]|uniref:ATP-binding cassette domain-containing protein n=1 Tax=Luteolibacter yonseiensis TaxID=1144680 RepID=A0A934VDR9_9BACT|nr:ATP-binding cassette domain-containing protein [Luteolibacter yonseiensis]MBK1818420.1 ATP-binding cassette domain-containing protein [Luteolibacter yonseiensis]
MTRKDSPETPAIFEIANANVWRGDTLALREFSLTLVHGESVAILGPNGAGKSSFLKLLTGEVRPAADKGMHCRLFGEELWSLEEIRHRIGVIMPEEVARFEADELTRDAVLSSLRGAYGRTRDMRFSQAEKEQAMVSMELMGVAELANRAFGTLSSGERRRILIARALVHQPQVLVLDEPSTALDFAANIQLTGMLRKLLQENRDLLLVTHHPGEIPPEIDRVILLRDGRIFADGRKRDVLKSALLSELYDVPLKVSWSHGWCDVRPV